MRRMVLAAVLMACTAAVAGEPSQHGFDIAGFRTEGGVVLPGAHVSYGTYGTLDKAGDNAVLVPSHFMADMHGYDWLVGTGKALDPAKYFVVASELFGNGHSSSPSNTAAPFHGRQFPAMTIRDNVAAVHTLLTQGLHVTHLRAVIGFSMGAQQALQWAVSYPEFMDRVVATSGTAKTYGHGIVRLESQIGAIAIDPAFRGGDYTSEPVAGIKLTGGVWLAWLYSQEWWRRELWRQSSPAGSTLAQAITRMTDEFFAGLDANDLILQMRTWESNDVGMTAPFGGDTSAALRSISVPVLYMPSATDLYFPVADAALEARSIRQCSFVPIPSIWGHPAGAGEDAVDAAFLNDRIGRFLRGEVVR